MRKIVVIMLIMAVLSCSTAIVPSFHAFHTVPLAYADVSTVVLSAGSTDSSTTSPAPPSGSGDSGGIIGELGKIARYILDLPNTITKALVSALVTALINAVFQVWGSMINGVLALFDGVLAAAFIHTTYPGAVSWVATGNATMKWLAIGVAVILVLFNGFQAIAGKKDIWVLLKTLFISATLCLMSLEIANAIVWVSNFASYHIAKGALSGYTASTGMDLSAGGLTGDQIIMIPFEPAGALGSKISFSELFLAPTSIEALNAVGPQPHGGIIALLIAATGWLALCGMTIFRVVALCMGTILAPGYISVSVWCENLEPAVGWLALMGRTALVQVLWATMWQLMVSIQGQNDTTSLWGLGGNGVNSIILIATVYISYRYWAKPTAAQISAPVTLAGGAVIAGVGKFGEGIGKLVSMAGMASLNPELVAAGGKISDVSGKIADHGASMHGGRSVLDALDLSKEQQEPELPSPPSPFEVLEARAQRKYNTWQTEEKKKKEAEGKKKRQKYWSYQGGWLKKDSQTGEPVAIAAPPEDWEYMGEWPV